MDWLIKDSRGPLGHPWRFGEDTVSRLAAITGYIGHHGMISDWDFSPARLADNIAEAASDFRSNVRNVTDINRWKIDKLLEVDVTGRSRLRKPRINIGFRETVKGTLRLSWWPDSQPDSDFTYRDWEFEREAYRDGLSGLLSIKRFDLLRSAVGREPSGRPELDIRPALADIAIGLVEESIAELEHTFDVRHFRQFIIERGEAGQLQEFAIATPEEAQRHAERKAEAAREREHARLLDELAAWETRYSISAVEAVGLWLDMAGKRARIAERIAALRDIGAVLPEEVALFDKDLKRARSIMGELGIEPATGGIAPIAGLPGVPSHVRKKNLADRITTLMNTPPRPGDVPPPPYPSRTYDASSERLAHLGVSNVRQFVDRMNARLSENNEMPVTAGDYPTNKVKFERLLKRWDRLVEADPDPDQSRTTPKP